MPGCSCAGRQPAFGNPTDQYPGARAATWPSAINQIDAPDQSLAHHRGCDNVTPRSDPTGFFSTPPVSRSRWFVSLSFYSRGLILASLPLAILADINFSCRYKLSFSHAFAVAEFGHAFARCGIISARLGSHQESIKNQFSLPTSLARPTVT